MRFGTTIAISVALTLANLCVAQTPPPQVPASYEAAGKVIGKAGTLNADGSYRINFPRTDLKFTNSKGMLIPADLGLATYIAFSSPDEKSLAVGDFAMLEGEIDRVIDALRAGKFEIVSLHNHMTAENPRLFYVHFQKVGTVQEISEAFKGALIAQSKAPRKPSPEPKLSKQVLDQTALTNVFGVKPQVFPSGVVRFANPRKDIKVTLDDQPFLPGMGLGSWAAFHACECGLAMVMGDTACTRSDLQKVVDSLRSANIHITAIHAHIVGGSSEVVFLHYEGEGETLSLAKGIKMCWESLGAK